MPINISPFKPCWWLKNPHAQTIAATWFKPRKILGETDRVELADGDFIDIIWYGRNRTDKPLVLILHGLEGSEHSHYIRSSVRSLDQAGFRVVFMFHRGCSAEHNRRNRSYHSGETGDMEAVMQYIKSCTRSSIYAAVGFSLGANALLKYLGEQGENALVNKAIAISTPFDLHAACIKLDQGISRIYQRHLVNKLIQRFRDKYRHRTPPIKREVSTLRTFLAFDEHVTAAVNGFKGAMDYYKKSSSGQFLGNIRKPCLIIHAADDPFLPRSAIPDADSLPGCVHLELSEHGGHVGFLEGRIFPGRWLSRSILSFLV